MAKVHLACAARSAVFASISLAVAARGVAATPPPPELAFALRQILAKHTMVPALWGATVDHGRLTALGVAGFRKLGEDEPAATGDQIHLGSDTKAMTATLVGQLVQAKQLNWSDTMGSLFPDLRPTMNGAMVAVTVNNLLQHTAGLPHDLNWHAIDDTGRPLVQQRLIAVRLALGAQPLSPPGQKYAYSNVGFVILGAIVERKTGHPWEDEIATRLFKPLGMTTAGFGFPGTVGDTDQPWGHRVANGKLTPIQSDNPAVMSPAGRVHCDMADWARFVSQFCRTPTDAAPPLLDADTLAQLTKPAAGGSYAGGWNLCRRPWAGGCTLTHTGSNTMWYCVAWVAPNRGFAVLAAANAAGDDAAAACDEVASTLIRLHARPAH